MKLINQFSLKSIVLFLGSFGFFLGACTTVVAASEENFDFPKIFVKEYPHELALKGYSEFLAEKINPSFTYIRPNVFLKADPETVADSTDNIDNEVEEAEEINEFEISEPNNIKANETDEVGRTTIHGDMAISPEDQLRWIKNNIFLYFTEEEIQEMTLVIQAEDEISQSDTEWAAHAWVILTRLHHPGFVENDTIHGILTAPGQFPTYEKAMKLTSNPDIGRVVIDVMARYVLEQVGFTGEDVGRVVPETHLYWNGNSSGTHNLFYTSSSHRGDPYEPIKDALNTPYDT